MSNDTDNLVLEHLRAMRSDIADIKADIRDLKSEGISTRTIIGKLTVSVSPARHLGRRVRGFRVMLFRQLGYFLKNGLAEFLGIGPRTGGQLSQGIPVNSPLGPAAFESIVGQKAPIKKPHGNRRATGGAPRRMIATHIANPQNRVEAAA